MTTGNTSAKVPDGRAREIINSPELAVMSTKVAFKWSKKITPSQVVHLIKAERNVDKALTIFDSATAELVSANKFGPAEDLLDRMKVEKCDVRAMRVYGLYGKIISGSCDINKFQEAANFLAEMVVGRTLPNRLAWSPNEGAWNLYRLTYR
ncbi:hypothetical protein V6N13_143716 [Hibiscus sabdariffa]